VYRSRRTRDVRPAPMPPLDPAVIKLVDALARAQAKEDHDREGTPPSPPPSQ
jgi:hypothetical protein